MLSRRINRHFFSLAERVGRIILGKKLQTRHLRAFCRANTTERLTNLVRCSLEKKRGRSVLSSYPYYLQIDATNQCNRRCKYCPTGKGLLGREKGRMKLGEFKRYIDQVADYLYIVDFFGWGEPTLNPEIFDMIQYASSRRIYTALSTNFLECSSNDIKKMVSCGLDHLIVGVNGIDEQSYSRYHLGGSFARTMKNVRSLIREKLAKKNDRPYIEWQFAVFRYNQDCLRRARRMCREMGMDEFRPTLAYVEDADWVPDLKGFKSVPHQHRDIIKCNWLWSHLSIHWDGGVAPCVWEFYSENDFGNLKREHFKDVWNNDKFISARKIVAGSGRDQDSPKTICHRCVAEKRVPFLLLKDE